MNFLPLLILKFQQRQKDKTKFIIYNIIYNYGQKTFH